MSQHDQKHKRDLHLRKPAEARPAEELLHELQVYQIELETQNDALKQSQLDLEQSRDRFVDFYEVSPVGYLTLNQDGVVADINLTGARLLKLAREEILNQYFSRFVQPADGDFWHLHFVKLLSQDDRMDCELRLRCADEARLDVRLDSLPLIKAGQTPQVRMVMTNTLMYGRAV